MPAIEADGFPLPTAPGVGVEFDESRAADHPFAHWEAPRWFKRDGGYTNW